MRIKNINPQFGEPVEFEGRDLPNCVVAMATAIKACGYEICLSVNDLCYRLRDGIDYEIIEEENK
jgi:hypothetical protein